MQASKPIPAYSAPLVQMPPEADKLAPTVAASSSSALQATVAPAPTPVQNAVYAGGIPLYPPLSSYPQVQADLPQPMRKAGSVAFKWGGIFGAILIVFILINDFLIQRIFIQIEIQMYLSLSLETLNLWRGVFYNLVACVIYFCLGSVASRQTGKIATGVIASLWANFWTYLIISILSVISYIQMALQYPDLSRGSFLNSLMASYVSGLLLALVLGAGVSALGGLRGRSLARKQQGR